ncbi:predicted protein [Pyrenophora tritici-repentis Pt-1C-BFP]|uniref:Uncharacterized protein n=2 Tax=Pyrenophora tritici-repentis TaxID=45151 RepID=A0A922NPE2_9PLEO|nr:uncharacterized protein PTRG_02269 [Pyrenophora tritici-repentis Pt-1C-BFP]EDU41707.1 predicted protein [Pyrenophora tritici-repentis Pt-1C-BFP]KAI1517696.1 hypothetical protein Ptr86124_002997 [Pyrenophora tritici-repentis]
MSPQESPAYIAGLRKRMVAIRHNSRLLKNKLAGTVRHTDRDSHDGPTKQPPVASLAAHLRDSNDLNRPKTPDAQVERPHRLEPDDAEPPVDGKNKRKEMVVQDSKQRDKRETNVYGPDLDSHQVVKAKLEEETETCIESLKYAAVGRKRGKEIQKALHELESESSASEEKNPAPPPTRSTPSLLRSTIEAPANSSASFESNPYPEDAPPWSENTGNYSAASLARPLSRRHLTPLTVSSRPSNFSIFPVGRAISPIAPFEVSQHRITPPNRFIRESGSEPSVEWFDRNVAFGSNHPYFNMTPQQRRAYWEDLSSYFNSSQEIRSPLDDASLRPPRQRLLPGNERPGAQSSSTPDQYQNQQLRYASNPPSYAAPNPHRDLEASYWNSLSPEARRLAREHRSSTPPPEILRTHEKSPSPADTQIGTEEKRRSAAGLLIKKLTCRAGAATPVYTGTPRSNPFAATPAPQKYGIAYLRRKIQRGSQTDRLGELCHRSSPSEEITPPPPSHSRHNKVSTAHLEFPPIRLSSMIQRAPASIRSTDNIHSSTQANIQPGVRTTSLPNRSNTDNTNIRNARIAALGLRSNAARAIREAMFAPGMQGRMADVTATGPRRERYEGWGHEVWIEGGNESGERGGVDIAYPYSPSHTPAPAPLPPRVNQALSRNLRFAPSPLRTETNLPRLASPLENVPDLQIPRYPNYNYNNSENNTALPRRRRTVSQPSGTDHVERKVDDNEEFPVRDRARR